MKDHKVIAIIVFVLLAFLFSGCGTIIKIMNEIENKGVPKVATIVNNDGVEEQLTSEQLRSKRKANEAKFEQQYVGAEIYLTGEVSSVSTEEETITVSGERYKIEVYYITMKVDWTVIVLAQNHPEVVDLSPGDTIEVKSRIAEKQVYDTYVQDIRFLSKSGVFEDFTIIVGEQ